ncbi:hypothetical protein [Corynebacterium sp.]|uniref:hypothetical protein n=1 Tax=Corynebacterium sp. TaxID=1720 RepID=UPI0026DCE26A|nr:hypothetical protein [Corynebacterium sp.]MDO5032826.1 hypothetical protein [Corynebacterium sp.]
MASFESQDAANGRALEVADAGGSVLGESMPVVMQPDPGYSPFGFAMPVVSVGASLSQLVGDLFNTKYWDVSEANVRWGDLSSQVESIVSGLNSAASSLEAENQSEATTRAAQKIREVASAGTHFVSNAAVMKGKLFGFQSQLMGMGPMAAGLLFETIAIPEVAAREAAEKASLVYLQGLLQQQVIAAMPFQHPLMTAPPASGGGDVSTQFGNVAGGGERYNTEGVAWPKQIAEAIANGTLGPGSFGVANGQMEGLQGLGMDDKAIQQFHADMHNAGRDILNELGFGNSLAPIDASAVGTRDANAGLGAGQLGFGPQTGMAGAGLPGAGSGVGAGTGSAVINPQTTAAGVGAGGLGGFGAAPGMMGFGGARGKGAAGLSTGGSGLGALGTGGLGAGGLGSGGLGAGGGALAGEGYAAGAAGRPGALGAGQGAGVASASAAQRGAAQRGGAGMRGMMPLMAGAGRGGDGHKRIKSVTSAVERDPNRRDLLGEAPAVVPGVIGAWAREERAD